MKLKRIILEVFFLFFPFFLFAQENVISTPLVNRVYGYQVLGKEGVLIYFDSETEDKKLKMHFQLYDTNFVKIAAKAVTRPAGMSNAEFFYSSLDNTLYFLTYDFFAISSKQNIFKIYSFDVKSKTVSTLDGTFAKGFYPTSFYVMNHAAYIFDADHKWNKMNLEDGSITPFSLEVKDPSSVYKCLESADYKNSSFVFWDKPEGGKWGFKTRNFGEGKENKYTSISSGNTNNLASLAISQTGPNEKIAAGIYTKALSAEEDKKFLSRDDWTSPYFISDEGFYITKIVNNVQEFTHFFPYPVINSHIVNKAKWKPGEKVSKYTATVHPPLKMDNTYIVIADIFKADFEVVKLVEQYDSKTITKDILSIVKDEYKYTLVTSFDQNGNVLWKDSFEVSENPKASMSGVNLEPLPDNTWNLYSLNDGSLQCKHLTAKGLTNVPIRAGGQTLSDLSDEKDHPTIDIKHWYGNTCLYIILGRGQKKLDITKEKF